MTDTYETNHMFDHHALPSELVAALTAAPAGTPHEGTPAERPFGLGDEEPTNQAE